MSLENSTLQSIVQLWFPQAQGIYIEEISIGLINCTWRITINGTFVILQRVNTDVFQNIEAIDNNWRILSACKATLSAECLPLIPDLLPCAGIEIRTHARTESGVFRMLEYIPDTICPTVIDCPETAFQAAKQFGKFCASFDSLDPSKFQDTIPNFHNLSLRYHQLQSALSQGLAERIETQRELIQRTLKFSSIVDHYEQITTGGVLKKRITHHDTKISNVLLHQETKEGIAVIDLDTVMAGFFISDLGDMFRTQLCPVDENCADMTQVTIRLDIFQAILEGYLSEIKSIVSKDELRECIFSGEFMIYMQAIRFATDYLQGDVYYRIQYPTHNLVRWENQIVLLEQYVLVRESMQTILDTFLTE